MRHDLGLGVSLVVPAFLSGIVGCAPETRTFQPPSAEIREQLATSSVHLLRFDNRAAFDDPSSGIGAGALHGAGVGAKVGGSVGATPGVAICYGTVVGCVIGVPLAIVMGAAGAITGGLVGTGVGAGIAHSEEEVKEAGESLRSALVQTTLADDLFAHLQTARAVHGVQHLLPLSAHESVAEAGRELQQARSANRLEITPQMAIDSEGEWDPDLSIRIMAHARLRRGHDQALVYRRAWEYRSPWEDYFDLAEDDARQFRAAIDNGLRELADAIVSDLFVANEPEINVVGPVAAGQVWTTVTWTADEIVPRLDQQAVAQPPPATGLDPPATDSDSNAIERPGTDADMIPRAADFFGAIAISTTSTFRSGACVNEPTREAAESCALNECGRHCEIQVAFGAGQCAAVSGRRGVQGVRGDSPQNRWRLGDYGIGESPAAALESAMAECRQDNRNCRELVRPVCNG